MSLGISLGESTFMDVTLLAGCRDSSLHLYVVVGYYPSLIMKKEDRHDAGRSWNSRFL